MKNLNRILLAVLAVLAVALPSSAQFRFGIKGGLDVNSVNFSDLQSNFESENRTGYTAGITTEFTVPIVGIGFDLSVMYVHRVNSAQSVDKDLEDMFQNPEFRKQDFIEIPLNLKYKLSLPVVGHFVTPYLTTGPSIAFKCSKEAVTAVYKDKKFDAAWNLGGGVQLLGHLQVGVNYGWGLTKSLEYIGVSNEPADLGKNNGWKITAAYFF